MTSAFIQSIGKLASYIHPIESNAFDDECAASFIQDAYNYGWVRTGFDWPAFSTSSEAALLRDDVDSLSKATWDQLTKLLTVLVRQERFGSSLRGSSGVLLRIIQRAESIARAESRLSERHRGQIREVVNRNTFVSLALEEGFVTYLPVYDSGIDLILHRESDAAIRIVQLKGRWTIDRKYLGRDIWVAFPIAEDWYLMPHDQMVSLAETEGMTKTDSWISKGQYNVGRPSSNLRDACAPYRFRSIADVAKNAAQQVQEKT